MEVATRAVTEDRDHGLIEALGRERGLERATWPDERVLKTTLADLPATAVAARLRSPTLLVVGEVAALAQVKGLIDAADAGAALG